jgi:alkyl sulfatase BDS1-like metallo-beta-lactamase superfamily hydrolase
MEGEAAAREVKAAFLAVTKKPVRAIIYTHNHADHVFGGHVMAGDDQPAVYSHASTAEHLRRVTSVLRPAISRRSMRQFGVFLPEEERLHCGIGPALRFDPEEAPRLLWPTHTFEDQLRLEVAGLRLELFHAPGETPDQIGIWLPERKVLLPADNIYQSFPNLYAIRGTGYRDVLAWVETLDKLRSFGAEVLVPSHTRPLHGAALIERTLRRYRDAIQYVHDQTVQGINRGWSPDELAARIKLPPALAAEPWLQEHYGRVDWSARAIYQGYLGWFDEDAAHLHSPPPQERAAAYERLAGGREALLEAARAALGRAEWAWGLELVGHVLAQERDHAEANALRSRALRAQAEVEVSANGRNYLLTQAREAEGALQIPAPDPSQVARHMIGEMPVEMVMRALPPLLDAARSLDVDQRLSLRVDDCNQSFTLHVRGGVAALSSGWDEGAELKVVTRAALWKELLVGLRSPAAVVMGGDFRLEGGHVALARFLLLFRGGASG